MDGPSWKMWGPQAPIGAIRAEYSSTMRTGLDKFMTWKIPAATYEKDIAYYLCTQPKEPYELEEAVEMMNAMTMKRVYFGQGEGEDEDVHKDKKQLRGVEPKSKVFTGELPKVFKSTSDKIMNMLIAVGDMLDDNGFEETSKTVPREALTKCNEARGALLEVFARDPSLFRNPPERERRLFEEYMNPTSSVKVTPWKSSEIPTQLPPLPRVLDPTLEVAAFTHQGMGSGRVTDLSYERLEWVGDSYLYLTATLLISQTFPTLLPGKCSQLRERLIKNITLADYARQYGFEKFAKIPKEIIGHSKNSAKDQDFTKIMGDVFEAYVAAVILSDPENENGLRRATQWLKQLWSMTLKKEIINEEKGGMKYDSPMWRLRGKNVGKVEVTEAAPVQLGPKEELQKLLGSKGVKLTYKDAAPERKDKNNKLPLFTVGVYLDGYGFTDKQLGYGTANGKKDAGNRAAAMALASKTLMKQLMEKKKVHDARLEQERQALESVGGK